MGIIGSLVCKEASVMWTNDMFTLQVVVFAALILLIICSQNLLSSSLVDPRKLTELGILALEGNLSSRILLIKMK